MLTEPKGDGRTIDSWDPPTVAFERARGHGAFWWNAMARAVRMTMFCIDRRAAYAHGHGVFCFNAVTGALCLIVRQTGRLLLLLTGAMFMVMTCAVASRHGRGGFCLIVQANRQTPWPCAPGFLSGLPENGRLWGRVRKWAHTQGVLKRAAESLHSCDSLIPARIIRACSRRDGNSVKVRKSLGRARDCRAERWAERTL
jgi:hypothetical protein